MRFCIIFLLTFFAIFEQTDASSYPNSEWNLATYEGAFATFNDGLISIVNGSAIFAADSLNLENIRFAKNLANENGGAITTLNANILNGLFLNNMSQKKWWRNIF